MSQFQLQFDPRSYRRTIAGKDVIIHCHHYNARVQRTLESAVAVDGRAIIRGAAETVFAEQIAQALRDADDSEPKLGVAEQLYAQLGYGRLVLTPTPQGRVHATSSHYVEGWLAGFGARDEGVCTFTEGYIQAAIWAATGELVHARERECMARGDAQCVFEIDGGRTQAIAANTKQPVAFEPRTTGEYLRSQHVDEPAIIQALVDMPIHGNAEGLIPAFSVYLANTPADYYNLICIRFVEQMSAHGRDKAAKRMLIADGETCAMNTFRGIMNSVEWEGLVAPMIHEPRDNIFALVAISNGLGWGNWHITAHPSAETIEFESLNGYEALGYREYRGRASDPTCFMLTGVAAGLLELVYGVGTIADRLGTCGTRETACISRGDATCGFAVERSQ
ncbi:V4R domain-containing protein [Enhygromyxa salina]|uniref:V4R domain protein n=1 Tax=Enhygromyxa salina TaxID=215803 RepID=A0A2S9YLM1_9BACT|nr:V4R domain-containing protein [Enhygromyxa salina]PRQ05980.1 V4R domain protein [Enhygromyxa salina]